MQQPDKPSIDEILRSIQKVVARDNERIAGRADDPALEGAAASAITPVTTDEHHGEGVLELTEVIDHPPEPGAGEAAPLVSQESTEAIRGSLGAFATVAEPAGAERTLRTAEASLDELTRELLRPMMAAWLDRNLPPLVERLVREEIARVAGRS